MSNDDKTTPTLQLKKNVTPAKDEDIKPVTKPDLNAALMQQMKDMQDTINKYASRIDLLSKAVDPQRLAKVSAEELGLPIISVGLWDDKLITDWKLTVDHVRYSDNARVEDQIIELTLDGPKGKEVEKVKHVDFVKLMQKEKVELDKSPYMNKDRRKIYNFKFRGKDYEFPDYLVNP